MGLARPIAFSPRAKLDVNRLHFGRAIFGQMAHPRPQTPKRIDFLPNHGMTAEN
jgi:hypothetical protein